MRISKFCLMIALVLAASVMAHAGVRVPIVLAVDVPEPSTAMVGAGALLIVLGLARRRQKK